MIAVSDTGPLLYLSLIDCTELFHTIQELSRRLREQSRVAASPW